MSGSTSTARQRIESLLDENSFVEIGALVCARSTDFNLKQVDTPSDGVITGYGVINDNLVYVYSQDASVLNGSVGEMHARKIANLYDMALKMGAPVIGLIDSTGLRLQEATDALNGLGQIYQKQALCSGVIPQITAIFGSCGGGLAILPGLADFTFMETKSHLFVNAPNAICGNSEDKCDTSAAAFQSEESGNADFVCDEAEIYGKIRELVSFLPANNEEEADGAITNDDLNRASNTAAACYKDAALALTDIADDNQFIEFKANYGKDMVAGFIKLDGMTVGCVANRSVIYDENGKEAEKFDEVLSVNGCVKAAEFINFCDAFSIPVLSLTNVTGFKACKCAEKRIARAVSKLTYAFANATVPKVNVVLEKAFGSAYVAMNSKALGCDVTFAWEDAQIGTMDAKNAAKIMYDGEAADVVAAKAGEYASLQESAMSAAKRGYVDYIIKPEDTRKYVIGAFEMLYSKNEDRPAKKHGTV
ncbi:MAG: carboxyl transferase [Lachnospiraceae bacterium]|nr:carboxyl transferase [Lachnospiraceae bacterium]